MDSKKFKLPTNLSNEELLSLLTNNEFSESSKENPEAFDDVLRFLQAMNIQPGPISVASKTLYMTYKNWSEVPLDNKTFHSRARSYLSSISAESISYYKINQNLFDLAQKTYKLIENKKQKRRTPGTYKKDAEKFMSAYSLKPGDIWIESYVLYYLYDKWAYDQGKKKQWSAHTTVKVLKAYLPNKVALYCTYFKVDPDIFKHVSQEEIQEVRKGRRNRYEKKALKKVKGKVPRA